MIDDHRPPPALVLDVGCSFGGFGVVASDAGYDVFGMDITPAAVEHVRSLGLDAERAASPADLVGVADGTVDVVTCLDCNTVWADQPAQLAAIRAKLRPGGHLVMRVVDKSWMFTIGRNLRPIAPRVARRLLREAVNDGRFSMPVHTLQRLLAEQDFEVVTVSIRDAVHSDRTRWPARAGFVVGAALWPLLQRNLGPGAVIVATRGLDDTPATRSPR
jgi:SAM-dependent methyltransferase